MIGGHLVNSERKKTVVQILNFDNATDWPDNGKKLLTFAQAENTKRQMNT